ncbi:hypothetical protein EG329_012096 [Mollisiaceae sp. DMI_Dod_QoI]|nr:hypothetical protein EG329_012096 [Helotiales sp. DMI_Dod_QoI]
MSSAISPFMELPVEIRVFIYKYSFETRESAFQYGPLRYCEHNRLAIRTVVAFGDPTKRSCEAIRDYTFTSCSRRFRQPQLGFLALRLANRQIYQETYTLVKLPLIRLRTHNLEVNKLSINSFLQKLDKPWLRDYMKELTIDLYPTCNHFSNPQPSVLVETWYNTLINKVGYILMFWKRAKPVGQQEVLCSGDRGATIQPLAELLSTFPLLETFKIRVVQTCPFSFSLALAGSPDVLSLLRDGGVNVDFQPRPHSDFFVRKSLEI